MVAVSLGKLEQEKTLLPLQLSNAFALLHIQTSKNINAPIRKNIMISPLSMQELIILNSADNYV